MSNRRTVLVLANEADQDTGLVGDRLREHGYELRVVIREQPGRLPDPRDHDVVISLGSAWSTYWKDAAAAVVRETQALQAAAAAEVPMLGICFGSQLVAAALGGTVGRASELEVGWTAVATDEPELVGPGPWFQWHGDSWTAPPGARVVARTAVCAQAFTLGRTLAVQFHPEVTPEVVERWAREDPRSLTAAGVDPDTLLATTRRLADAARSRAAALVDAFLERCVGTAAAPGAAAGASRPLEG
ncbi:MAG: type 1 glutamine amidotransferase [Candidatus Dormibacteria bacterium]